MQTSWRPTRRTLPRDRRFMRSPPGAQRLLLTLYVVCDGHGRGPTDAYELRQLTGYVDDSAADVDAWVGALAASELIHLSEDGTAWELEDYDAMLTEDQKRKRSKTSAFPPGRRSGALTAPKGQSEGMREGATTAPKEFPPTPPLQAYTATAPYGRRARVPPGARVEAPETPPAGAGVGSGAQARPEAGKGPEPGQDGAVWPSAEHQQAAERWLDAVFRFARNGIPSGSPCLGTLAALARQEPAGFIPACATTVAWGETWEGWRVRNPIAWLRTECRKAVRMPPPKAPPPPPDPRTVSQRVELEDAPDLTIALDTSGLDPAAVFRLGWEDKRRRAFAEGRDGRRFAIADRPDLLSLLDWTDQLASREPPPSWFVAGGRA